MKRLVILLLTLSLVFSMSACGNDETANEGSQESSAVSTDGDNGYEDMRIRMSFSGTSRGMDGIVAERMKENLYEKSGGKIVLETYPDAQLAGGDMQRQVEMFVQGGSFEMAIISEVVLDVLDERLNVTAIPFSYSSYDEAYEYADSTGGEWSRQTLAEHGIHYLIGFSNSIMHLTNNQHEIRTPEDLEGLRMRTIGDYQLRMMRELGADPIQMNWSEVYSAMQMGTIDGHMNGFQTIHSANIHEVQDYLTVSNVTWGKYDILANSEFWESIPEQNRELIDEVAIEAALWARDYLEEIEEEIRQEFEAGGMTITELSDEEYQAFVDAASETRAYYMDLVGEEACEAWGIE